MVIAGWLLLLLMRCFGEEEGRNALQQASVTAASKNRTVDMLRVLMLAVVVLFYLSVAAALAASL